MARSPLTAEDPVAELEHDHAHLTRLVDGLRDSTQACLRGELEPIELRADFDEFLRVASDELYEHFDREESALFPYIVEQCPDLAATIAGLESGHDRICGLLGRMDRMVTDVSDEQFSADFEVLIALFARLDACYVQHARAEGALLRSLATRLDEAQRREVGRLLAEI